MRHLLDLGLSPGSRAVCMTGFKIQSFYRLAPSKILGSASSGMLGETLVKIGGDPRIEGVVGAKNDVDLPVHLGYGSAVDF